MTFPDPNPESLAPIFVTYCIDYRYNAISAEFFDEIDYENSYYLSTNAGASLPLGYEEACKNINKCKKMKHHDDCCIGTDEMYNLRESFSTNLRIALTLKPIKTVYLLNHQDCGAIRAFLPCSGYPDSDTKQKEKEICIHAKILTYAKNYMRRHFAEMEVILGLIDSNGTVGDYDTKTQKWVIIHVGSGQNEDALWFGYKKDDIIQFNC